MHVQALAQEQPHERRPKAPKRSALSQRSRLRPAATDALQTAHEASRDAKAGASRVAVATARKSSSDSISRIAALTGSELVSEMKYP